MLELIVRPLGADRYRAVLDGRVICRSSRQPLLDGARVLLAEGVDPGEFVGLRRAGSSEVTLWSRVGVAAGLTVDERYGTDFRRWEADFRFREGSPERANNVGVTTLAAARKTRQRCPAVRPACGIERDAHYPGMWRVKYVDGGLSDMVNLARAKDALWPRRVL